MTIIQIVGTNSAGKTTAMRSVLGMGQDTREITGEKGKTVGHTLTLADKRVRVLGPYTQGNALCVGMDKLGGTAEWQYQFIKENHAEAGIVLYEGMRLHNFRRTAALLNAGIPIHLVLLTTPIDVVLDSLTQRRAAKGQPPLQDVKHVLLNDKRAKSFARNLYQLGAELHQVDRETAPTRIVEIVQKSTLLFDKSAL
jgi:hypothetical protein